MPNETPDTVHGRLMESAHFAGYSLERALKEFEWLLEDNRWKQCGNGFENINDFLVTINFSEFKIAIEKRKEIAKKLSDMRATQRTIAKTMGVNEITTARDLGKNRGTTNVAIKNDNSINNKELKLNKPTNVVNQSIIMTKSGADVIESVEKDVNREIKNIKIKERMENIKRGNFYPFIYNIWNTQFGDGKSYFGHFPEIFMENLLHYHTKENDLVYDPFAGTGTTIDVCKRMRRRYYCSDLKPSREEIKQWDIADGIPKDIGDIDIIFLDPPYWILAKTEYSESENDLGNVHYDKFTKIFNGFLNEVKKRNITKVAYVIRPIWDTKEEWEWIDPLFDFYIYMHNQYKIEARYVLPYSTQQYNGLWVNRAKEKKKPLILNRELIVLRNKYGKIRE